MFRLHGTLTSPPLGCRVLIHRTTPDADIVDIKPAPKQSIGDGGLSAGARSAS